jgi:hypothetical protein
MGIKTQTTRPHDRLGWQDKERKVRPVGRFRFACKIKHASNIVTTQHNLLSSASRCSRSAIHTLRRVR